MSVVSITGCEGINDSISVVGVTKGSDGNSEVDGAGIMYAEGSGVTASAVSPGCGEIMTGVMTGNMLSDGFSEGVNGAFVSVSSGENSGVCIISLG